MVVIRMPRDPSKAMADYANLIARSFRGQIPDFQMANLTPGQDSIGFSLLYTSDGLKKAGVGVVVLKGAGAWWVSYGAPAATNLAAGTSLLTGVVRSVADGGTVTQQAPAPAPAPAPGGRVSMVGNWSTMGYYGDIVDRSTGAFRQTAHSGEWYTFNADGTYKYTHVASGMFITGAVITTGTYDVSGSTLRLHQKLASWYPMANDATRKPKYENKVEPGETMISLEVRNANEIVFTEGTMHTTFKRGPANGN